MEFIYYFENTSSKNKFTFTIKLNKMIDWTTYIESNPNVLFGKPILKNTRIPVDLILEKLAEGHSTNEIFEAYPNLKSEHLFACFAFAAYSVKNEVILSKAS